MILITNKKITLFLFFSFWTLLISPVFSAINFSKATSENQHSQQTEQHNKKRVAEKYNSTLYSTSSENAELHKNKVIIPEKKEKLIQGYRFSKDRKGREKTEYVYGVIEKGNNNIYTGYLYGPDNKQTLIYGDPTTGVMEDYKNGTINVDSPVPTR